MVRYVRTDHHVMNNEITFSYVSIYVHCKSFCAACFVLLKVILLFGNNKMLLTETTINYILVVSSKGKPNNDGEHFFLPRIFPPRTFG
jgi:hypothetical protein